MKSNNYIRKIDELGRIVIPKEVRTKLKIQDNESILITLDDNKIIISKYSYLTNYIKFINEICDSFTEIYKTDIKIMDKDKIIFENNSCANYLIKEDIIKNSVNIGTVELTENNPKLIKLISRIISSYLLTSW